MRRLLVMNGQRLLQAKTEEEWKTEKVDKAPETLKPGIYNLSSAVTPTINSEYTGHILHLDDTFVYQQVGTSNRVVAHPRDAFQALKLRHGMLKTVRYNDAGTLHSVSDATAEHLARTKSHSR